MVADANLAWPGLTYRDSDEFELLWAAGLVNLNRAGLLGCHGKSPSFCNSLHVAMKRCAMKAFKIFTQGALGPLALAAFLTK